MMLVFCLSLSAQVIVPGAKFKLITPAVLDLNMFYSSELHRLYVEADFDLQKDQLDPTQYNGVFLSRDTKLQSLTIAGQGEGYYYVNNITAQNFQPELSKPELLAADSPARFHGMSINNYQNYPDTVRVKLMYYLDMPEFRTNEMKQVCAGFGGDQYWYPHSLTGDVKVNVKLETTPYFSLMLGNSFPSHTDQGFKRMHQCSFMDVPPQPQAFRLIKD
jgi:hypothetical protein